MQINEITQPRQLNEVDIVGGIKSAAAGVQNFVGNLQQQQQQKTVQQNTQAVATAAQKQWNNKVLQLTQASGGQPVDQKEYHEHLRDFIEKTMLNNRSIDNLDANSSVRLDQAIDAVVLNRSDTKKLQQAFQQLAGAALVARDDPNKVPRAASLQQTATITPQQASSAIKNVLQRQIGAAGTQDLANALKSTAGGATVVRSTGNPATDALLNQLGMRTQ